MNILISLYDYTGNASRPYDENGWKVYRIDIQNGIDILKWDFGIPLKENNYKEIEKNWNHSYATLHGLCSLREPS